MENLINRATLDVFAREIFEQLETSDLVRCREASRSWMNFIDGENLITDESRIVEEYFKDPFIFYQSNGNTLMHYATLRLCNLSENEEIAKFKCKYKLFYFKLCI